MGKSGECFCVVKMSHLYAGARFYELLWLSSLRSDLIPTILYSVHAKKGGGKSCVPTLSHILQKDKNIHKLHEIVTLSHTCYKIPMGHQPGTSPFSSSHTPPLITFPPAATTPGTRNPFPFQVSVSHLSYSCVNQSLHCIRSERQNLKNAT